MVAQRVPVDARFGEAELESDVEQAHFSVDGPLAHRGRARDVLDVCPATPFSGLCDIGSREDPTHDREAIEDADAMLGCLFKKFCPALVFAFIPVAALLNTSAVQLDLRYPMFQLPVCCTDALSTCPLLMVTVTCMRPKR